VFVFVVAKIFAECFSPCTRQINLCRAVAHDKDRLHGNACFSRSVWPEEDNFTGCEKQELSPREHDPHQLKVSEETIVAPDFVKSVGLVLFCQSREYRGGFRGIKSNLRQKSPQYLPIHSNTGDEQGRSEFFSPPNTSPSDILLLQSI
jgi:hypothetical protein